LRQDWADERLQFELMLLNLVAVPSPQGAVAPLIILSCLWWVQVSAASVADRSSASGQVWG